MAMKVKAILVGAFEGNKLYYLLQPHGEAMLDGAVVSVDGQIDFVKFFHFITTTPQIQELQFSKFHKFLWSPGSATEEREKWNRIFLKKTQPIDDDLLIGATVITTLGAEEIKRKDSQSRADEFRRKTASTGGKPMEMTILSRKSLFNTRGAIGFKALGPLLGGKPSLDGDGDGFVDDGLPTMRPFIPGFDFLPDASTDRGLRSITTSIRSSDPRKFAPATCTLLSACPTVTLAVPSGAVATILLHLVTRSSVRSSLLAQRSLLLRSETASSSVRSETRASLVSTAMRDQPTCV